MAKPLPEILYVSLTTGCTTIASLVVCPTAAQLLQVVLLVALAKVLAELQTVDEATLQQCLHVTQRIVASYRGLWPKQRLPVHAALNILLAGLRPQHAVLQSLLPRLVSMLLTYTLRPADPTIIAGDAT